VKRALLWLYLPGFALALLATGCLQQESDPAGPQTSGVPALAPIITPPNAELVPDAYIVVLKQSIDKVGTDVDEIERSYDIRASYRYESALQGFAAKLSAAALEALRRDPRVAYIERDQVAHAIGTQTPATWGLDRIDQHDLPLDNTYNYNQTGTGVDAYIIDTGIRITHNEFGGRAVAGVDEITPGGNADDANGHGTHVAGTVGGTTYGVAKNVHLIAVRVLDASGSGTFAQVIAGVDWVTSDHTTHLAVANMSLGGSVSTSLDNAVRNSIADGVTYCVAAGNSASNVSNFSPADVAEAITVGATNISDGWASFSNFGAGVDILGPGVNVTSAWNTSNTATNTISGTSMATPHVTGASALFLEANPSSTPAQVAAGLTSIASANKISGVPAGTVNLLLFSLIGAGPPPPPPGVPEAPTLVSPSDGTPNASRTPTLTWNASTGATSYHVQASTSSSFASLTYDNASVTGTSVTLPLLDRKTTYFWHVSASNSNGTSAYSSTFSFRTRPN
jgi:subtilisin family serine protease